MASPLIFGVICFLFQINVARSLTADAVRQATGLYSTKDRFVLPEASEGNSSSFPNVSKACSTALLELATNASFRSLLGVYIDAAGKPESGVTTGNVVWYGSYALCQTVTDAHYCLADVNVNIFNKTTIPILWGLCVPRVCSERDVAFGLNDIVTDVFDVLPAQAKKYVNLKISLSTDQKTRAVNCAQPSKWTTGPIITLVICAILAFLCLVGTLVEMIVVEESWKFWLSPFSTGGLYRNGTIPVNGLLHSDSEGDPLLNSVPNGNSTEGPSASIQIKQPNYEGRGFVVNFLLCFSMIRNTKKIMDTTVPASAITSLNGVRVLSMWWVILGHTYLWLLLTRVLNDLVLKINITQRFSFQSVNNAFFAVDSFFLLSGVLVAYLSFRRMEKNNGKLPLFQFYFHRFWRLTPCYMFVILFYANLTGFLGDGPMWFGNQRRNTCDQYWWTNLLYINNFHPNELVRECLGWSWYLANDMQFYVISPILLFIVYRFGWIGVSVGVGSLLWASFIVTGTIIGVYNTDVLMAGEIEGGFKPEHNRGNYSDLVYIKPYCRISPYLVGIVLGYLLYREKSKSSFRRTVLSAVPRQVVSLTGWCLAIILGLSSVYGIYSATKKGGKPFNLAENIIYGTFSRFVWSLALAWVIYACNKGYGSLVNKFLSARFWIPLSRLTYSAYLLHPIVITAFFGSFQHTAEYTDKLFAFYYVSVVVMSYAAAFALAVCVEFPTMQLESVLFFRAKHESVRP